MNVNIMMNKVNMIDECKKTTLRDIKGFSEVCPLIDITEPACQCCNRRRPLTRLGKLKMWLSFLAKNITVEPVLFLNVLAWTIQTTLITNMVLEKVCQAKFNQMSEVCQNLTNVPEDISVGIQKVSTRVLMVQEVVANIPAVLYVLVLGTWSDKYGRKLPMLLPFIGSFLATLIYIVNAYVWWLPVELTILAGIPRGLSGGFITLLMATYSYITDISDHQSRTLRMAFLDFMMFIGTPLGLFLSNVIFTRFSYMGVFTVSCSGFLLSIIYIVFRIKDTQSPSAETYSHQCPSRRRKKMIADLLDLSNVKSTLSVATRRRENYGRAKIFSLMLAMCLLLFKLGGLQLKFLYTKKKFNWNYEQFVHLSIYDIVFGSVGTSLVLPVLSYKFKIEDSTLGLVGCVSKIAGLALIAISPAAWFLYLAATVSFLAGLPLIVTRAVISKLVPAEEVGAVFSLLASWEALVPLVSVPVYTIVYSSTIDTFPGTIYFLSCGATAIAAAIYLIISVVGRRSGRYISV